MHYNILLLLTNKKHDISLLRATPSWYMFYNHTIFYLFILFTSRSIPNQICVKITNHLTINLTNKSNILVKLRKEEYIVVKVKTNMARTGYNSLLVRVTYHNLLLKTVFEKNWVPLLTEILNNFVPCVYIFMIITSYLRT